MVASGCWYYYLIFFIFFTYIYYFLTKWSNFKLKVKWRKYIRNLHHTFKYWNSTHRQSWFFRYKERISSWSSETSSFSPLRRKDLGRQLGVRRVGMQEYTLSQSEKKTEIQTRSRIAQKPGHSPYKLPLWGCWAKCDSGWWRQAADVIQRGDQTSQEMDGWSLFWSPQLAATNM